MSNPFTDQAIFMTACGQTVNRVNLDQTNLYWRLVIEEVDELQAGWLKLRPFLHLPQEGEEDAKQRALTETIDGGIDVLVVVIGMLMSLGVDAEGAWNEVIRSNLAKIDPHTGKVLKRADGKVLKPEGWTAPDLTKFATKALEA